MHQSMQHQTKFIAGAALLILVSLLLACAPAAAPQDASSGSTGGGSAGAAASAGQHPKFDALVAKAKAAPNKEVTGYFEAVSPNTIRFIEDKWKQRFGFAVTMASIPGHSGRDAPVQILAGNKANQSIADVLEAVTPQGIFPAAEDGALLKPDWEALADGFPEIKRLREGVPPFKTSKGEPMSDFCMVGNHLVWTFVYNTQRVKPDEVKGLKYEDLAKPQWKNRVVMDNQLAAIYLFPKAPGWNEERMTSYVKALKPNGVKAVAGGSFGVIQAVLSGQADLGIAASINSILPEKNRGAPIDMMPSSDGWMVGLVNLACVPRLTKGDPALAQLFWGWFMTEGQALRDQFEGSGNYLFNDSKNKAMDVLKQYGLDFSKAIYPVTQQDLDSATRWRKLAIDAFTGQ